MVKLETLDKVRSALPGPVGCLSVKSHCYAMTGSWALCWGMETD